MIPQAIAIVNGKGGVLKSTLAANLAGLLAVNGYKVLLVELDKQGNTLRDLGLFDSEANDQGARLVAALTGRAPLEVVRDARPALDHVAGGDVFNTMAPVEPDAVDLMLAPLAGDYDIIILDCPPGDREMQIAALTAAHWAVIPTKTDYGSIDGLSAVARMFVEVRDSSNPDLELLGVVLTAVGAQSRAIMRRAREKIVELFGDDSAMLLTVIRYAEAASDDARRLGLLAHEMDRTFDAPIGDQLVGPRRFAASAPGVAGDHQRLAAEIAQRISERVAS